MNKRVLAVLSAIAPLALLAPVTPATASTVTANFTVSATVGGGSCSISAGNLSFGTYDPSSPTPLDAQSQITLNCVSGLAWNVGLGSGLSGIVSQRGMILNGSDPSEYILYQLYQDSARSNVWGDTVGTDTIGGTGTGASQVIPVYGRIPAEQQAATGSFMDFTTATLTF